MLSPRSLLRMGWHLKYRLTHVAQAPTSLIRCPVDEDIGPTDPQECLLRGREPEPADSSPGCGCLGSQWGNLCVPSRSPNFDMLCEFLDDTVQDPHLWVLEVQRRGLTGLGEGRHCWPLSMVLADGFFPLGPHSFPGALRSSSRGETGG